MSNLSFQRSQKIIFNLVLLLSFFIWLPSAFSQMDSLEQLAITTEEGIEKVDLLNEVSFSYCNKDIVKAAEYANQSLEISNRINYPKGRADALQSLCVTYIISGDYENSKILNEQVIHLADSLQDNELLIKAYNMKASNLDEDGRPDEAIKYFQKALDLATQENNAWGLCGLPLNIGTILKDNKSYKKAREYFQLAIENGQKFEVRGPVSWGHRLIAETYLAENKFADAADFFKKALEIAEEIEDIRSVAFIQEELSRLSLKTNKIELAEQYALEAIALNKKVGGQDGLATSTALLIEVYLELKQPNKAIRLGRSAIQSIPHNPKVQLDIEQSLAKAYAMQGNFELAYKTNLTAQEKKDSFDLTAKLDLAAELEEKYQSSKKDAENALLKLEQEKQAATIYQQKTLNIFLVLGSILLLLVGGIIYNAYKVKQKNNVILEEKVAQRTTELQNSNHQLKQSNKELERFAYVASHDLREPLRNIINFSNLLKKELEQTALTTPKSYVKIIHDNTSRMNDLIAGTLEFTRLANKEQGVEKIDPNKTINDIKASIHTTLQNRNALISVPQKLPDIIANKNLIVSLFKNLIENGIKYNEHVRPEVIIECKEQSEKYLFSIKDNGIGIPNNHFDTVFEMFKRLHNRDIYEGTGMGLANCKKIINNLGGEIWVESDGKNGANFFFTLPSKTKHRRVTQFASKAKIITENAVI